MRTFRDARGLEWTVFAINRSADEDKTRWSYLPEEFEHGWLCFESALEKRRLMRIPEHWRESSDAALARLLSEATPVRRLETPSRSAEDLGAP